MLNIALENKSAELRGRQLFVEVPVPFDACSTQIARAARGQVCVCGGHVCVCVGGAK